MHQKNKTTQKNQHQMFTPKYVGVVNYSTKLEYKNGILDMGKKKIRNCLLYLKRKCTGKQILKRYKTSHEALH